MLPFASNTPTVMSPPRMTSAGAMSLQPRKTGKPTSCTPGTHYSLLLIANIS